MQTRSITKHDLDAAREPSLWDFGNNILYDMCEKFPEHTKEEQVVAKVLLIGRSYSAALERGRKVTDDGNDFYLSIVGPGMKQAKIDSWFKTIPVDAAPGCSKSIEIHRKLQDLFRTMIDRKQRSLASKYLHFHFPDIFFLFDSRAAQAIASIVPRAIRKAKNSAKEDKVDLIYNSFARSCVWLRDRIHEQFGVWLTPRELDKLLLAVTDNEPKSTSRSGMRKPQSKFIGKASDFTVVKGLLKTAQKQARKAGMKKSDIEAAIRKVRKRS